MKTIKTLSVALMLSLFAASLAQAQNKPAEAIDEKGLKTMLENLGYEPKPAKLSDDRTGYYVPVKFKGLDAEMLIQISPNGANLWGTLTLSEIKAEHHAEGSRLFKLLQLNQKHGPCHFYVTPSGKYLCLTRGLYIKGVANKEMRAHIDSLVSTAEQTIEDWDTSKWTTPVAAPTPVDGPK